MKLKQLATTLALGLALAAQTEAADVLRYEGLPSGSKVRMDGDSSIHKWYAESTLVSGFLEFAKDFKLADVKPGPVQAKVEAAIPVRTLKCSSGKAMDNVMYDAMKVKEFPRIEYRLQSLECKAAAAEKVPAKFEAKGQLVVMGTTNPVTLKVTIEAPAPDRLLVKMTEKVRMTMTSFKITPPKLSFLGIGMITTDDNVDIVFEWLTAVKAAEAK